MNFFAVAGFDIILVPVGSATGEPASNSRSWIWGAPCMPGGDCGEQHPCGRAETVQIQLDLRI